MWVTVTLSLEVTDGRYTQVSYPSPSAMEADGLYHCSIIASRVSREVMSLEASSTLN